MSEQICFLCKTTVVTSSQLSCSAVLYEKIRIIVKNSIRTLRGAAILGFPDKHVSQFFHVEEFISSSVFYQYEC